MQQFIGVGDLPRRQSAYDSADCGFHRNENVTFTHVQILGSIRRGYEGLTAAYQSIPCQYAQGILLECPTFRHFANHLALDDQRSKWNTVLRG
jgi:hypothetical protein